VPTDGIDEMFAVAQKIASQFSTGVLIQIVGDLS